MPTEQQWREHEQVRRDAVSRAAKQRMIDHAKERSAERFRREAIERVEVPEMIIAPRPHDWFTQEISTLYNHEPVLFRAMTDRQMREAEERQFERDLIRKQQEEEKRHESLLLIGLSFIEADEPDITWKVVGYDALLGKYIAVDRHFGQKRVTAAWINYCRGPVSPPTIGEALQEPDYDTILIFAT